MRWSDQVLLRPWKCLLSLESVNNFLRVHTNNSKSVFSIHESMSEMFFFLFDLVCFGRYLQFEQYISGIILSFLLCGCALAYVFIHIGQLLYLPFSNYETVVKQLKADICIRNPLPGNHFDHSCHSLQLVGCKRPFLESNCHYLHGSFKGFYVHP